MIGPGVANRIGCLPAPFPSKLKQAAFLCRVSPLSTEAVRQAPPRGSCSSRAAFSAKIMRVRR
jgi:hypothetical protein